MKKKGFALLLAFSVLIFTGCGIKTSDVEATTEAVTSQEATQEDTEAIISEEATEPSTQAGQTTETPATEAVEDSQNSGVTAISPDDAQAMLMMKLGERDEQTGNEYSYCYIENVQINGVTYLVFDWRWMVDDHMSKLADIFVTADGSAIYEGYYNGPENSEVYLDSPLYKQRKEEENVRKGFSKFKLCRA